MGDPADDPPIAKSPGKTAPAGSAAAPEIRRPIGVLDEAQRFEVVGGVGLEGRSRRETRDEMRYHPVEARLVTGIRIVALAARARAEEAQLVVLEDGRGLAADDLQPVRRARRVTGRRHRADHLDRGARCVLEEDGGDRLAGDIREGAAGAGADDAELAAEIAHDVE